MVARHLSFKQAAAELNVTPGAVSQRIQVLEEQLGVALFKRQTRSITLSAEGKVLVTDVDAALSKIESGLEKIWALETAKVLTIYTTPVFAERWLLNRLPKFRAQHPQIPVQVVAAEQPVTFELNSPEIAIRFGAGDYQGCASTRLFDDVYIPVCDSDLGLKIRDNLSNNKMTEVTFIHCDWATNMDWSPNWLDWLQQYGSCLNPKSNDLRVSHESLAIQAAITAQGIALVNKLHVQEELEQGVLVNPYPTDWILNPKFHYYLVEPNRLNSLSLITTFKSWLIDEIDTFNAE